MNDTRHRAKLIMENKKNFISHKIIIKAHGVCVRSNFPQRPFFEQQKIVNQNDF
jgi:hypothetical protein